MCCNANKPTGLFKLFCKAKSKYRENCCSILAFHAATLQCTKMYPSPVFEAFTKHIRHNGLGQYHVLIKSRICFAPHGVGDDKDMLRVIRGRWHKRFKKDWSTLWCKIIIVSEIYIYISTRIQHTFNYLVSVCPMALHNFFLLSKVFSNMLPTCKRSEMLLRRALLSNHRPESRRRPRYKSCWHCNLHQVEKRRWNQYCRLTTCLACKSSLDLLFLAAVLFSNTGLCTDKYLPWKLKHFNLYQPQQLPSLRRQTSFSFFFVIRYDFSRGR